MVCSVLLSQLLLWVMLGAHLGCAPCTQQGRWHSALGHTADLLSVCLPPPIRTLQGDEWGETSFWVSPVGTLGLL